jgi:hypothetical protein
MWELSAFVAGLMNRPEPVAPSVEAVTKAPEKPAPVKRKMRAARLKSEPEVAPLPPAPAAAKRFARFPTAQEIRPGVAREELRAEYGEPNLRASLYDRGSLLETFVYQNEARSATTWARLRNVSVIASATAGLP